MREKRTYCIWQPCHVSRATNDACLSVLRTDSRQGVRLLSRLLRVPHWSAGVVSHLTQSTNDGLTLTTIRDAQSIRMPRHSRATTLLVACFHPSVCYRWQFAGVFSCLQWGSSWAWQPAWSREIAAVARTAFVGGPASADCHGSPHSAWIARISWLQWRNSLKVAPLWCGLV